MKRNFTRSLAKFHAESRRDKDDTLTNLRNFAIHLRNSAGKQ
jgi:hypothetical protein